MAAAIEGQPAGSPPSSDPHHNLSEPIDHLMVDSYASRTRPERVFADHGLNCTTAHGE